MHRAHDYAHLIQRWRRVAREARLKLTPFASAGRDELFYLSTVTGNAAPRVYISAGIHGDEAGATEGLITWAEKHVDELLAMPALIFPCLNPWGLRQNTRYDEFGNDLNRAFDRDDIPSIVTLREILRGHRFAVGLALHEDYDAQGIYLYEGGSRPPHWGETILREASAAIPVDPRSRIDFGRPKLGVMRRRFDARHYVRLGGLPEAVYLQRQHTPRTITFETPSEFGLETRAAAHVLCIEACFRMARSADY